jgi:hypothetical protein
MERITTVSAVVLTILSCGTPALAQGQLGPPLTKMPQWDAGGSIGMHWGTATKLGESEGADWLTQGEYRFDFGRYWTPHLKTELGFSTTNEWHSFEVEPVPLAGLRGGGYSYIDRTLRLTVFSPAVTYQFLENSLMHPYLSGGMRINVLREYRFRNPTTYRVNAVSFTVPRIDEHRTTTTVNPFVAAGCKSYVTSHTFVRSEALVAFGRSGSTHAALRLGFGVDF